MLYRAIDACRACGSTDIPEVLNLGDFYISDFEDSPDAFVDKAPLELVRCEGCSLVQLRHTVDRDRLYKRYWYRSGTQPAMVSALRDVVGYATARTPLNRGDVVIDIGANDGTLLRMYPEGIYRIAYEPAENLWPALSGMSRDPLRDVSTIYGYFPHIVGGQPLGCDPKAKIITSIACFYDVDDPGQFVEGIKANLAEDGIWINQMSNLYDTLATGNFGDICHEHLTYWTFRSFTRLCVRHGIYLQNYGRNDVNGGSTRFTMGHRQHMVATEVTDLDFKGFARRIEQQREDVREWLLKAARCGDKVIGYGASTKGNTYLQYWGIDSEMLPLIADRNPDKWGKYTPTGQLIISEAEARDLRPDYFFCLPWHFIEAFVEREKTFLACGGQFVVPFPTLHFVGGDRADLQPEATVPDDRATVRP